MKLLHAVLGACVVFFSPVLASAHEVYVLSTETIARDIAATSPNPFIMVAQEPRLFIYYGIIGVILVSTVFAMSITHFFERLFNPLLNSLKFLAAPIARITLGVCLIASAYHFALFGPELPLEQFGQFSFLMQIALFATGVLCLLGLWTRTAGIIALGIFLLSVIKYDIYMLTYANYLGEICIAIILGSGRYSLDHWMGWHQQLFKHAARKFEPYAFPLLRILFGISIVYAPLYAKLWHSQLALDVVPRRTRRETITSFRLLRSALGSTWPTKSRPARTGSA